jgi:SAM-dependent methyltransferase
LADGRDVEVWDNHAHECRDAERKLFEFTPDEESAGGWLRSRVLEVLEPGSLVLDLGCGPGYWRKLFEGMDYTGFDQSTEMLVLAKEVEDNSTWIQGNARQADEHFSSGKFSMVFMASVLQHNRHEPDKREIVEAVHKLVRAGGYFLLTENTLRADNCPQSVSNLDFTDGYSFTPKGWDDFLLPLGFKRLKFNGKSEYLYQKV